MTAPAAAPVQLASHVEVHDLVVTFGRRRALDGMELTLAPGVHGLLGPNGAGKTTLMRVLATVAAPTAGSVRMLGRALDARGAHRDVRRRLGYLPQTFGFYPRFRVREFVEYVAWLKEVPGPHVPMAVDRAIERVGLADRADDRMKSLSGGMLRRVGVDSCVLVSTHLIEDVAAACSTVTLMDDGRSVFRGTPAQLVAAGLDRSGTDVSGLTGSGADGAADGGPGVDDLGDTPTERGYTAVLRAARSSR